MCKIYTFIVIKKAENFSKSAIVKVFRNQKERVDNKLKIKYKRFYTGNQNFI